MRGSVGEGGGGRERGGGDGRGLNWLARNIQSVFPDLLQ